MTRAVIVDASAFKHVYDDLVDDIGGNGKLAIDLILQHDYILIDEGGRIKHEWRSCSCGESDEFFNAWITQRMIEDKIREAPSKVDRALRAKLNEFGMPADDRVYFFVAVHNQAFCIISEDSDLYDPRAKLWSTERKRKLREEGRSCVARYMRRQFGIAIFPLTNTVAHFEA